MARSDGPKQSWSSAAPSASTDAAAVTQSNFTRASSLSCRKRPAAFLGGRESPRWPLLAAQAARSGPREFDLRCFRLSTNYRK